MPTAHERDIPSISAKASEVKLSECYSRLSFALANSLAVAKRLTWEQTPWLNPNLEPSACTQIAEYVSVQLGAEIPWEAFQYACLLGETYEDSAKETGLGTYPQLFLVFPHLRRDVSKDEGFLRVWHDELILPAFNRSWEDSELVEVTGANKDFVGRIKSTPGGLHHSREAYPVAGFLDHLRKKRTHRVHTHWPEWHDPWNGGHEGKFTDKRAKIFDEAWLSIRGMLKDHPQMKDFQGAFLLVVNRAHTDFSMSFPLPRVYKAVGNQWDKCVDARYIMPGTFKVVVENVVGDFNQIADAVNKEEQKKVVDFKRTIEAVGDASTALKKRRKTIR
jgi:hypothetical protein